MYVYILHTHKTLLLVAPHFCVISTISQKMMLFIFEIVVYYLLFCIKQVLHRKKMFHITIFFKRYSSLRT